MVRRRRVNAIAIVVAAVVIGSAAVAALLLTGSGSGVSKGRGSGGLRQIVADQVASMPDRGSGIYKVPTASSRSRIEAAWASMEAGQVDDASAALGKEGYRVDRIVEPGSRRPLVVVSGSGGLFVHAPDGAPVVVEVPHPRSDRRTERLGVDLFLAARARTLIIAGAHRDSGRAGSADVARRRDSVFHTVHLAATASPAVTIQLHGFAVASTPDYDVIVSSGGPPSDAVVAIGDSLAHRFRTCTWRPGLRDECRRLGGTTNVQAQASRAAGTTFVHLELAPSLRLEPAGRGRIVRALVAALPTPP